MMTLLKPLAILPLLTTLATPAFALDFPKYEKVTKGNTTVLLMKQDRVPLVSIRVTLDFSDAGENFNQSLASLYLHSIKYGSLKFPGNQWLNTLEATGGELEENVSANTISLATEVRKEDAERIAELLIDGLLSPQLMSGKVIDERGRLIAELDAMGDQPERIAGRAVELAYFGEKHKYGMNAFGTPKGIAAIKAADLAHDIGCAGILQAKLIISMVGDTTPGMSLILDKINHRRETDFEMAKRSSDYCIGSVNITPTYSADARNNKRVKAAKDMAAPRRVVIVNLPESQQTQVRLMMAGPTDIYSPLRLASLPLGGSFTSRLVDELRVKRGLTYSARSSLNQRKLASVFEISSFTKVPSTGEFLKVLFDELNKAKKPGLTAEEIARGKALFRGMAPQRWERYSGLAAILEDVELRGLPADYPLEVINRMDKNSQAEAQAALNAALDLNHYVLVLAGPAAKLKPIAAKYGTVEVWEKKQVIEP